MLKLTGKLLSGLPRETIYEVHIGSQLGSMFRVSMVVENSIQICLRGRNSVT